MFYIQKISLSLVKTTIFIPGFYWRSSFCWRPAYNLIFAVIQSYFCVSSLSSFLIQFLNIYLLLVVELD